MKTKKMTALFLAATMAAGVLTGCGGGSDKGATADTGAAANTGEVKTSANGNGKKVTIRFAWWGGQERADLTNEAVNLFMEKKSGYRGRDKLLSMGFLLGKLIGGVDG